MDYKTRFVQDLCKTRTENYEELLHFASNEAQFLQNVRNLRKPSVEALLYVLLMKQRGTLPGNLFGRSENYTLRLLLPIINENHLRLQSESDTFGCLLSALAVIVLLEPDAEVIRSQAAAFVTEFEENLHELPLYYDVLRTLLILAKERPELEGIFHTLDARQMVRRLTSASNAIRMKSLACLQLLLQFNPRIFDEWLLTVTDDEQRLMVEQRAFMVFQLMETLLQIDDDRSMEMLKMLQCDHVWTIVMEGLRSKDNVCRKESLAVIQYAIGYAKQCNSDINGTFFHWPQNQLLSTGWQSLVTIIEALSETQAHLILPAMELLSKVSVLDIAWRNVVLGRILLHESPHVVQYGIQHFLELHSFDAADVTLEKLFLETFNRAALFEPVQDTIHDLTQHYNTPAAFDFLLDYAQVIPWNSVQYYCVACVMYEQVDLVENADRETLKALEKCVKCCQHLKNVSLRYVTVLLLLKTIAKFVKLHQPPNSSNTLLSIMVEVEKILPKFSLSFEQLKDESGSPFCDMIDEKSLIEFASSLNAENECLILDSLIMEKLRYIDLNETFSILERANLGMLLHIIKLLPEYVSYQHIPKIWHLTLDVARKAIESETYIDEESFCVLRDMASIIGLNRSICEEWKDLLNKLYEKIERRLIVCFDYSQSVAIHTIQLAHICAVQLKCTEVPLSFYNCVCLRELRNEFRRHVSTGPSLEEVYVMISEIYLQHAKIVNHPILVSEDDDPKLVSLLEVGNHKVLSNVISILYYCPQLPFDDYDVPTFDIIRRCYKEILNYRKSDHFMSLLKSFIEMLFKPYQRNKMYWIDEYDVDCLITCDVAEYINKFLEQASTISGLANIVFENLLHSHIGILLQYTPFGKLLLRGMIFGDVQKREQRIENEALEHCGMKIDFLDQSRYVAQADARVRVLCVLFLYQIAETNHPDAMLFLLKLERMLIEKFTEITKAKERYYADSITHRQKLRIIQALCVVLKLTGTKPYPLLEVMLYETNQPNINYLIELIVADSAIDTLTIANKLKDNEVKVSGIQSIFVILWLRCCQTKSLDKRYIYLLLPWTMAQNFSTRLYAQIVIKKLIATFFTTHGRFKDIYAAVDSYLRQGNVERNIEKCMQDFRFNTLFDYANLLTLENIFHNIPRVSGAPPEDVVGTQILRECFASLQLDETNLGEALDFGELSAQKKENLFLSQSVGGADFIQRKIVPLKSLEPNQELLFGLPENLCLRKMDHKEGLIVVASLVNRAPNLGGLARTCEIFAVKQLVINSLRDIDNKEFQALSMTAEKWLNVGELKAHQIVEYLREMKTKGYAIVGAEQTTGCKPIQQLVFPKKSILVLGHEKNGLPANIIRHLDLIGEIPQFGVVRSLNVHVTGAIFIWEYAKQHHLIQD
ncbi:uncharacterized protein LOC128279088 [Anopheles cruzii]|uniref:uncharacterized protein LOC128279088 n=1 Tax=Anopheles cruzii TaxID=68878 RepID=UPI0022EC30F5|nr:uncharacterized protein LOC128279088 [Anopheles cruzii]